MVEFIHHYLWELFIITEVLFWVCIVSFLLIRYVLGWKRMSVWIFPLFILSVLADAYLGWVDYQKTGEFSIFQFIVIIFIVYAVTSGLSDFRRLDVFIQRKIAQWKGEPEPTISIKLPPKYGREHAKHERIGWYIHIVMFLMSQLIFVMLFGTKAQFNMTQLVDINFYRAWWDNTEAGLYRDAVLNQMVKAWFVILAIDGIISLSYTFAPRKEQKSG